MTWEDADWSPWWPSIWPLSIIVSHIRSHIMLTHRNINVQSSWGKDWSNLLVNTVFRSFFVTQICDSEGHHISISPASGGRHVLPLVRPVVQFYQLITQRTLLVSSVISFTGSLSPISACDFSSSFTSLAFHHGPQALPRVSTEPLHSVHPTVAVTTVAVTVSSCHCRSWPSYSFELGLQVVLRAGHHPLQTFLANHHATVWFTIHQAPSDPSANTPANEPGCVENPRFIMVLTYKNSDL